MFISLHFATKGQTTGLHPHFISSRIQMLNSGLH